VGLDDTIERRWGKQIAARGIYRDPVRSSRSHFVKTSGLRWLSLMLLAEIPWAGRVWALPFLTVLAPSTRYDQKRQRRHKTLPDWGRQMLLQLRRWLPERSLVLVVDSGYAALDFLGGLANRQRSITCITRLRLDAQLYAPAPPRRKGQIGRPRRKGVRLPSLQRICQISFFGLRTALGPELPRLCKPLKIQETFPAEEAQLANFLSLMNQF
jgi:hypothetical protein